MKVEIDVSMRGDSTSADCSLHTLQYALTSIHSELLRYYKTILDEQESI